MTPLYAEFSADQNGSSVISYFTKKYPAVHQHISHLHSFLLFAGCDQNKVSYVLLPEVLDFATRLDHILPKPGGSWWWVKWSWKNTSAAGGLFPQHCHSYSQNYTELGCEELQDRPQSGMLYVCVSVQLYEQDILL